MYLFSIPDSYECRMANKMLIYGMLQNYGWFYNDFRIETAYGCMPRCIWNGNRMELGPVTHPNEWVQGVILETYSKINIRYRLTFTNFLLRPEHLYDTYGNKIAEALSKVNAYAMVSTQMMYDYLAEKYPALTLCWSTTTDFGKSREEQVKKINELSEKNLVVLPYEFNNKPELDQLQHPENIEVLVNEKCIDNCPYRREHWAAANRYNLMETDNDVRECHYEEELKKQNFVLHHLIKRENLGDYAKKGIVHFKVEGRGNSEALLQFYLEWFVKPEFRGNFINFCEWCQEKNFGKR